MLSRNLTAAIVLVVCAGVTTAEESKIRLTDLREITSDAFRLHEYMPRGVPRSFDWALTPRLGKGNDSSHFEAFTGWGQIYQGVERAGSLSGSARVGLKNFQVYFCDFKYGWKLVQGGKISGANYIPTYSGNAARPVKFEVLDDGVTEVELNGDYSFHFWPKAGRVSIPPGPNCGVVVLIQAKLLDHESNARRLSGVKFILGLGADYWETLESPWREYSTNKDVAIGRFRSISDEWQWYGLNTASKLWLSRFVDQFDLRE